MAYNKRQHLADNMAALEYLFMRPEFCLTEEGRKVLNGYTGFGGLKCILKKKKKDTARMAAVLDGVVSFNANDLACA